MSGGGRSCLGKARTLEVLGGTVGGGGETGEGVQPPACVLCCVVPEGLGDGLGGQGRRQVYYLLRSRPLKGVLSQERLYKQSSKQNHCNPVINLIPLHVIMALISEIFFKLL